MGSSAVAAQSVGSRVQKFGPSREAVSPAGIFLRRLRGCVVGFESLRQGLGGLRNGRAGKRRGAPPRGFGQSSSRARKFETRAETTGPLRGCFSEKLPELASASRTAESGHSRRPLRPRFRTCEFPVQTGGACKPSPSRKNHEQAIPTQALKRTAGALSTGGGRITGVAVTQLWWQRRPARLGPKALAARVGNRKEHEMIVSPRRGASKNSYGRCEQESRTQFPVTILPYLRI